MEGVAPPCIYILSTPDFSYSYSIYYMLSSAGVIVVHMTGVGSVSVLFARTHFSL